WQHPPENITHDVALFRTIFWKPPMESLAQWQGRYFGLSIPETPEPWLKVDAPKHDRIVIGRTSRYNTYFFPWRLIVEQYGKELLFLGLPEEYHQFQSQTTQKIDYAPTNNLLEATKLIAGSKMFIGNQSVLF